MTQKHGVIFGNLRETAVLMKFWNAQNVTIAD